MNTDKTIAIHERTIAICERELNGLVLFRDLIKDGCEWHGDVASRKWSEAMHVPAGVERHARQTLELYTEGEDYRWEGEHTIWIA